MQDFDKEAPSRFGILSGFAFTINSCIGAGFLSIPGVYQTGGWLLALSMHAISLIFGAVFSFQLIEISSRVEAVKQHQDAGNEIPTISLLTILKTGLGIQPLPSSRFIDMPQPSLSEVRQYDPSEIVKILMGKWWSYAYLVCICINLMGALTAYANIFGTAFGTHVPIIDSCDFNSLESISINCRMQYLLFVSIFLVIMIYFTNIDFKEQLWMQAMMTGVRIFVIGTIIILSIVSLILKENINNDETYRNGDPPLGDMSQFGFMLPALLFGGIYQTQFSSILITIRKDMKVLRSIVWYVTITLEVLYIMLGVTTSFAVNRVASNVSLSFGEYSDGYPANDRPIMTEILSYALVLCPAIDVMSIFPIVAQAISDNILALTGVSDRNEFRIKHWIKYHGLRTVCIIPPFAYAFSQTHLGTIVNNSGFFVFFLVFFMIPLMHIASRIAISTPSQYDCKLSPLLVYGLSS